MTDRQPLPCARCNKQHDPRFETCQEAQVRFAYLARLARAKQRQEAQARLESEKQV